MKEHNRCVICGKIGFALRESLTVCADHMKAIDEGWTFEVKYGEYTLVDLEEIDYPTAPIATQQPADDGANGDSGYSELIDELNGRIKGLERESAAARERIAALEAALLECTVQMNKHGNDDNWETITMDYAAAIKQGREILDGEQ